MLGRGALRGPPQNEGTEMRQHQHAQEAPREGSRELWGNEMEAPALLVLATTPTHHRGVLTPSLSAGCPAGAGCAEGKADNRRRPSLRQWEMPQSYWSGKGPTLQHGSELEVRGETARELVA